MLFILGNCLWIRWEFVTDRSNLFFIVISKNLWNILIFKKYFLFEVYKATIGKFLSVSNNLKF